VGCLDEGGSVIEGLEFLMEPMGKISMVRAMDCIHGIVSTVLDNSPEAIARRELYGKPGAHRPKEYGVEYRVLSNYWLKSQNTVMLMYYLTQDALEIVRRGQLDELIDELGENEVQNVIAEGRSEQAMEMLESSVFSRLSEDSLHYFNEAKNDLELKTEEGFHKAWGLYKEKTA
jgi:hypothetical protein